MLTDIQILTLSFCTDINKKDLQNIVYNNPTAEKDNINQLINIVKTLCRKTISSSSIQAGAKKALDVISSCSSHGIKILVPFSENFPQSLQTIPDQPVLLYAKGNVSLLSAKTIEKNIAIVGSRETTASGLELAKKFATSVCQQNGVVVSGLALGTDTAAHQACVDINGKTIAVLAHGLDEIYPKSNKKLSENILKKNGCLLSEYPPQTKAFKNNFVARNRLISGISQGVIITEASEESGTLHTANACLLQKKKLACVIYADKEKHKDANIQGNKKLIQQGATAINSMQDFTDFLQQIKSPIPNKISDFFAVEAKANTENFPEKKEEKMPISHKRKNDDELCLTESKQVKKKMKTK